jgi:hypothetical protein
VRVQGYEILSLNGPAWQDVAQLHSAVSEHLADEQPAVALSWLALAAHQGDSMFLTALQQALDRRLKSGHLRHQVIAGATLLVVMLVERWPASKLISEEEVASSHLA